MRKHERGITLIALIISIIVLVILAGVAINTLYGENGIITTTQDVAILSNIKSLEENIDLYKIGKNLDGKIEEESYPIALNEDGSKITLSQMRDASELAKLSDEVKYTLLNLTAEKGTTNIPTFDQIDYDKFYKLDYTKLNISEEEAENLVIYVDGDNYKVINLAGVKYKKNNIYVIIPLNNESEPEYITVANNTYKLYGDGTLKVLGEKTVNSGYTSSEVNTINSSWDEFDLKAINERFDNRMRLPEELTSDWYASHVYFSTGTAYVIDNNSDLWAWGANDYNKLGLGQSFLVVEPTKILEGRCDGEENVKATKVWAGNYNTFIIDNEEELWGCGNNSYGTLGQGNTNVYNKWIKIDYIDGKNIKEIKFPSDASNSKCLIVMQDGTVYGAGMSYGELGSGSTTNTVFREISEYKNAKEIYLGGSTAWLLKQDGSLYGCGHYSAFGSEEVNLKNAVKIADNVKEVREYENNIIYTTEDKKIYVRYGKTGISQLDFELSDDTILLGGVFTLIKDKEIYRVQASTKSVYKMDSIKNCEPYYNKYGDYKFLNNTSIYIVKDSDNKIYIKNRPNITKIGEKSNYNLRMVFNDAIFVQGKGNYISIVDRNGKIYESTTSKANAKIDSARKIIASSTSKYIIKNDGTLWAKGARTTGMWGPWTSKDEYVQITEDGEKAFTNVKDIFTSTTGGCAIFTTTDNKVWWAGEGANIILPNLKGDFTGLSIYTYYPKEENSEVLEKIKDKIKDIEYAFTNTAGVYGGNTLILTEDGKLYTISSNKNMSGNSTVSSQTKGDFSELKIKEGTTVKQIVTQDGLSLALLSNGEVYGWGYNTYGILGPNYDVGGIYSTPVKLEGLPANIRYMSLGNGFAIFASKSGEVYGIGKNDYGQLGTGDSTGRTEFVRCTKLEE